MLCPEGTLSTNSLLEGVPFLLCVMDFGLAATLVPPHPTTGYGAPLPKNFPAEKAPLQLLSKHTCVTERADRQKERTPVSNI